MVLLTRDIDTGYLIRCTNEGNKLLRGCCHQAKQCAQTDCYANTPYQVSITYNITNGDCGDGVALEWGCDTSDVKIYSEIDFETYLGGAQTLTQSAFACYWLKTISIDKTIYSECYDGADPGCGGCCAGWTSHHVNEIVLRWARSSSLITADIMLRAYIADSYYWVVVASGSNTPVSGHCAKINSADPIILSGYGLCDGSCFGE